MNLLAVTRSVGMISAYGADGYAQIQAKFAAFQRSRPDSKISLAVLDDPASMRDFGGVAAGADADSLQGAVSRAAAVAALDGVLILGGDDVVPLYPIPNPVADRSLDPDLLVYTDNPYGLTGPFSVQASTNPPNAVGRVCAGKGESASAFCALLDNLIANHTNRPLRAGYVEVTNRVWENASASVASALSGAGRVLVCPNDSVTPNNASALDCKYLYCNLHGFLDDPGWKGQDPVRGYLTALSPNSFSAQFISGTVVYTDACYGLQTAGRPTTGSCALTLMARGAAAVIGATGLAFGTAPGAPLNLIDADALTKGFFNQALSVGGTLGSCLKQARASFAASGSFRDPLQQKTLLQFQLLGDPTLAVN